MVVVTLNLEQNEHLKLKEEAKQNRQSLRGYILSVLDKRSLNIPNKTNLKAENSLLEISPFMVK